MPLPILASDEGAGLDDVREDEDAGGLGLHAKLSRPISTMTCTRPASGQAPAYGEGQPRSKVLHYDFAALKAA